MAVAAALQAELQSTVESLREIQAGQYFRFELLLYISWLQDMLHASANCVYF
jgi:hypothetical protein